MENFISMLYNEEGCTLRSGYRRRVRLFSGLWFGVLMYPSTFHDMEAKLFPFSSGSCMKNACF